MRKEDEQTDGRKDREERIVDERGSCTEMDVVVAAVFRPGEEEVVVAGKIGGAPGRGAG